MKPFDGPPTQTLTSTDSYRADPAWLDAHWMPYTGNRDFKAHPRMMVSAQGCYYTDADGK